MTRIALLRSLGKHRDRGALFSRGISAGPGSVRLCEAKEKPTPKRKKVHYEKYGIENSTAQELHKVTEARREVDKWIYHPTFFNMLSDEPAQSSETRLKPPGKGPLLKWTTCMVFPYDGTSWHPRNRKVRLEVKVESLRLKPMERRRLLDIVSPRYKYKTDIITFNVDKYEDREENRKEALRILYNLLEEATNPIASLKGEPEGHEVEGEPQDLETSEGSTN